MLKRRGFTMIELMLSIVLLGAVGLLLARMLTTMLRVSTAQVQIAGAQATSRTGVLAIPLEFREIGFDTLPNTGLAGDTDTDLQAIAANRITFRAMRGMGTTCDISGYPNEIRVRLPAFGLREPLATDSFRLFVENDVNKGVDDQWVTLDVTNIDASSDCGPEKALLLSVNQPKYDDGTDVPITQVMVGGPVRWFEVMEYGPAVDPFTTRAYLGARSINLGQNTLVPMVGPLSDSTGFALTYFDGDGVLLAPTVATNRIKVRSIGINLTGTTNAPVSLSAVSLAVGSNRSRSNSPVFTRVALRNNLRETAP
ncbi:MAG TPA: prepilin-type N-terminal cleavage/methylation domain-containing protein [Gemmatimonadales bacterium]|jgi:prepilin-type N-terminal cleavage/methylation domain-containing protein|nr:prepilin-type N-terminal cleavage/methylation domain-containing protein [Gemmatimonadales bacterium]